MSVEENIVVQTDDFQALNTEDKEFDEKDNNNKKMALLERITMDYKNNYINLKIIFLITILTVLIISFSLHKNNKNNLVNKPDINDEPKLNLKEKEISGIKDDLDKEIKEGDELFKENNILKNNEKEFNKKIKKLEDDLQNSEKENKNRISKLKKENQESISELGMKLDDKIKYNEDDDQSQEELMEDINDKIDEVESVMTSISDFFGALFESHKQLTLELVDEIIKKYLPKYLLDTSSNFEKLLGLLLLGDMAEFLHQELLNNIWNDICTILIKYSPHANYEVRNAACYGLGVFAQYTSQGFIDYGKNIIPAVINVINLPIDKKLKKTDKENLKFARDNAISALGKIIKYHGQEFSNELNSLLDLWVNSMPIKQDKEEAKINNNFLLDILMKEPNKILGENNKNLGKIIVTLAEGYQTGATDEEMDKKIEQFALGVKSNPEYNNILVETAKKSKEKLQNKIKSLFKIDKKIVIYELENWILNTKCQKNDLIRNELTLLCKNLSEKKYVENKYKLELYLYIFENTTVISSL